MFFSHFVEIKCLGILIPLSIFFLRDESIKEVFTLLFPYIRKHWKYFIVLNISIIIAALAQTLIPLTISTVVDDLIEKKDKSLLYTGFFLILAFALIDLVANMSQRFASVRFGQNIMFDIRQDLYSTLQYQELEYYASETVGPNHEQNY